MELARSRVLLISAGVAVWAAAGPCTASAQHHPDLGSLADYPIDSKVWVGSLVGEVVIDPEVPIEIARPGEFEWQVVDGEEVAEGEVLGISGAAKINLSERKLSLDKSRHRQNIADLEWGADDKRTSLVNTIRDLEDRLSKFELTPTERELLGSNFAARLAQERTALETELKRANERLNSEYFSEIFRLDRLGLDLELERAEEDHKDLVRNSEMLAPAAGRVVIESREIVRAPTVMGKLVQDGVAEVTIELLDPRLRGTPGTELQVDIRSDDGLIYHGTFLREKEERTFSKNARLAVFKVVAQEGQPAVPASLAGSRMVMVMRVLPEPGHLIPKDQLLFKFPAEIKERGWNPFILTRWPGARILMVAPREIVVAPAHEN